MGQVGKEEESHPGMKGQGFEVRTVEVFLLERSKEALKVKLDLIESKVGSIQGLLWRGVEWKSGLGLASGLT